MKFLPSDLLTKLEFDKILVLLSAYCRGEEARLRIAQILPMDRMADIKVELRKVEEIRQSHLRNEPLHIPDYTNIANDLEAIKTKGYVLDMESIQGIHQSMLGSYNLYLLIKKKETDLFSHVMQLTDQILDHSDLIKAIEKIFDIDGSIKSNASPALQKIFRAIQGKTREVDNVFRSMINKYKQLGWLKDNVETFRNGRRVLSVNSENKRKIRGIIHDESSTGKTAFVEPEAVIDINNDIFDLENEKRKEVYRLLKDLCETLRPHRTEIASNHQILIELDILNAKASLALEMEAVMPKLVDKPRLGLINAYHPYLKWVNDKQEKQTIPFNLDLKKNARIVVISGPNAGGKSVTMKAVGLIQLMLQSGMLIPVEENSEMGVFRTMCCDIGDQQSLEDDLSTYSSRLKNMKDFIQTVDEHSLLLIDEFGSGTDPKIGGALAESLLREFNFKKVMGVITTHYSNIKYFAFQTKGIINASMLFDNKALQPTYHLKLGKPGSSFAFEIANKTGMPKKVMNYARFKTGKHEKAIDELLIQLQNEKKHLENKVDKLESQKVSLQRLISNYENMYGELQFNRKKLKLEKKANQLKKNDEENTELQRLIKELRQKEDLKKVEEIVKVKKKKKEQLKSEITELKEEVFYKDKYEVSEFTVGGYAKLRDGGSIGKIIGIKGEMVDIALGLMQMQMNIKELIPSVEPIKINAQRTINTDINFAHGFESKLDLRGYKISDALDFVQEFMDTALIQNVVQLKIVHGKGTGKLRQAIHKKLKEYKAITEISHPPEEFGGDGVTLINL